LLIVVKLGVVIVIKWINWYGVLWRKSSRDLIAARRVGSEEDSVELADEVEVCRGLASLNHLIKLWLLQYCSDI